MAATPLGEFEVLILMAVLHLADRAYAPAVREEIERRTGRPVARGAVYITLDRLQVKGLLASKLGEASKDAGGRARRYYRVAPRGLTALRRAVSALERMRAGLEPILQKT